MNLPFAAFLRCVAVACFCVSATLRADGQVKEPPKVWGEIPAEELRMTSYLPDSNATAVILFDYARTKVNPDYDLVFEHHRRIKILTTAGYEWATATLEYYAGDGENRLSDIEGATYVLDPSGEISRHELDENSIFTEEYDQVYKRTKFTLPALSPGCIVEYRYTMTSTNPVYLHNWTFQSTEPTIWTEYEIKIPIYYTYASVIQGYQPFAIESSEESKETFMGGSSSRIVRMVHSRWAMQNVPALREEPYMTTLDDYRARISFQLAMVTWPGLQPQKFLESWEKVGEVLRDNRWFGKQLDLNGGVKSRAKAIAGNLSDPSAKVRALYDFLRSTIVWDESNGAFTDHDLDEVLESKSGSAAEINLMLVAMLREVGVQADPVLLSTRGHGKIQDAYPIVRQFNYVICRAVAGGTAYLLDATDRLRPLEILATRALNHKGFLLQQNGSSWIPIEPAAKSKSVTLANVALAGDGSIAGDIQFSFTDYNALQERRSLTDKKGADYVKALVKSGTSGFVVDSFTVSNQDSVGAPLMITTKVSAPAYGQAAGDKIYCNPMTISQTRENPFKQERRLIPVDFGHPFSESYTVNLTLPDGYTVGEYPKDIALVLPSAAGKYTRQTQVTGSTLQLATRLEISKTMFEPAHYKSLRSFYEQIVTAEAEQIMLEKSIPVPTSTNRKK